MTAPGAPWLIARMRRLAMWLLVVILFAVALQWVVRKAAERYVRKQLHSAAAAACAVVDPRHPPSVAVDLSARSVLITGLHLLPAAICADASLSVEAHIDTAFVRGVSLIGLLFRNTVSVDKLQLHVSEARMTMLPDSLGEAPEGDKNKAPEVWSFAIGSFGVALRSASVITQLGDTIAVGGNGMNTRGNDLNARMGDTTALDSLSMRDLLISVDSLTGRMASGYAWSIGDCDFDQEQGALALSDMTVGPKLGLMAFSATLPFEADVMEGRLDSLRITGFDLNAAFATGAWPMQRIHMASGNMTILRDKLATDGNDPVKPLLSGLIRSLPVGAGADTVIVSGLDVEYRERVDRARGYAVVPITQIHATITGARHGTMDSDSLLLRARAIAFGTGSISLQLRARIADTSDRFDLAATIGPMPFAAINQATGPLLDMQASAGVIDSIMYRMTADDRSASGTVYMAHRGLKVVSGGNKSERSGKQLGSALLNALVRKTSRNEKRGARDGRFAFDRRRDRAIFNYLWSGLREGVKAQLLPELIAR